MEKAIGPSTPAAILKSIPLLVDFNTKMSDDGILLRYRGKQLVGVTVLDASSRR